MGGQPGAEVAWAIEVKQCFRQGFQLLQRQCLNAGRGGIAQGAKAAGQLPQCHLGGFPGFAAGFTAAKDVLVGPALVKSSRVMPPMAQISGMVLSRNRVIKIVGINGSTSAATGSVTAC